MEEALDKVLMTLKIFGKYRAAFREFKAKLPDYFSNVDQQKKPKTWDFQEHLVFKRFDAFVERLNIIKEFFKTAQQFLKLEKVEIGGIRGKALSSRINNVHEEFKVGDKRSLQSMVTTCVVNLNVLLTRTSMASSPTAPTTV